MLTSATTVMSTFIPFLISLVPFWIMRRVYRETCYTGRKARAILLERLFFTGLYVSVPIFFITRLLAALVFWDATRWLMAGISVWIMIVVSSFTQTGYYTSVTKDKVIGIFHPHCDQRAGGEMVLWSLINTLLTTPLLRDTRVLIYTNALPASFGKETKADSTHANTSSAALGSSLGSPSPSSSTPTLETSSDSTPLSKGSDKEVRRDDVINKSEVEVEEEEESLQSIHARHSKTILSQASEVFGLDSLKSESSRERIKFEFLNHSDFLDAVS